MCKSLNKKEEQRGSACWCLKLLNISELLKSNGSLANHPVGSFPMSSACPRQKSSNEFSMSKTEEPQWIQHVQDRRTSMNSACPRQKNLNEFSMSKTEEPQWIQHVQDRRTSMNSACQKTEETSINSACPRQKNSNEFSMSKTEELQWMRMCKTEEFQRLNEQTYKRKCW